MQNFIIMLGFDIEFARPKLALEFKLGYGIKTRRLPEPPTAFG
jgi:hypothetical protein